MCCAGVHVCVGLVFYSVVRLKGKRERNTQVVMRGKEREREREKGRTVAHRISTSYMLTSSLLW